MEQKNLTPTEKEREQMIARARELACAIENHAVELKKSEVEMKAYNEREARDRRQQHKYAVKYSNRK